jgi:hypothetical protein
MTARTILAAVLWLGVGTSCAGSTGNASSSKPEPRADWVGCYANFQTRGQPKSDLRRLTRACGPTAGMRAVTPIESGRQSAEEPADLYTFHVAEPRCYRIYAVGERGIEDLDLLLRGPDGEQVVADLTDDAVPILPPSGPICFETPGLYLLEVSVFRGSGTYAVQVWGS